MSPAWSTVTLKAKAAKGSAAEPRLGAFDGADLTDAGKSSTKSHTVKVAGVSAGDLELAVGNLGASTGDVTVSVKVKAPKIPSEKIDVRGEDSSGRSVSATVVADQGGEVEDPASSLAGASVTIAPGALPADMEITIASSDPVAPPLDRQMVGPTLDLGPSR